MPPPFNVAALLQQQMPQITADPPPTQPRPRVTPGVVPYPPTPPQPAKGYAPRGATQFGAIPVYVVSGTATGGLTPRTAVANVVATGGTPVVTAVGPINGGYITNPPNAAAQGIVTAENINVDMTTPPLAGDAAGFGTTVLLVPGQTFTIPALAPGVQVWVNATTSGHRLTVVVW